MIKVHVFREEQELTDVPVSDLSEVRGEPDTLVWADVVSGTPEELAEMGQEFDIHPVALEDCHHQRKQRPKVEEYPGHVLLVAYAAKPGTDGQHVELHELDLVAGPNFLVSFHAGKPIDAESVARRVKAHPSWPGRAPASCSTWSWTSWWTRSSRPSTGSASGSRTSRRRCSRAAATCRTRSSRSART